MTSLPTPNSAIRAPAVTAGSPTGPDVGLRIRLEPSVERFVDLRLGPQEQRPSEQCGDLLARDRDGNWTYQFAATVDDYVQGVTLVIRGVDLLASTGRQIQLARLLGRDEPPAFLHHPLIMKSPHQKLSKSDGDTGIRDLRAKGWTAGAGDRTRALADVTTSDHETHEGRSPNHEMREKDSWSVFVSFVTSSVSCVSCVRCHVGS